MIKNIIIVILIGAILALIGPAYTSSRSIELRDKLIQELSDELSKSTKNLKTSSCLLDTMTKIVRGDQEMIANLDKPCANWLAKDEAVACINQVLRFKCGITEF